MTVDGIEAIGARIRATPGKLTRLVVEAGTWRAFDALRVEDYYPKGKRWWVRLHEKGGKRHEMPAHHNLEAYL